MATPPPTTGADEMIFETIFAAIIAFVVGTFLGLTLAYNDLQKDCDSLGAFRVGAATVYTCKKEPTK